MTAFQIIVIGDDVSDEKISPLCEIVRRYVEPQVIRITSDQFGPCAADYDALPDNSRTFDYQTAAQESLRRAFGLDHQQIAYAFYNGHHEGDCRCCMASDRFRGELSDLEKVCFMFKTAISRRVIYVLKDQLDQIKYIQGFGSRATVEFD